MYVFKDLQISTSKRTCVDAFIINVRVKQIGILLGV